jgi:hypothetical protein
MLSSEYQKPFPRRQSGRNVKLNTLLCGMLRLMRGTFPPLLHSVVFRHRGNVVVTIPVVLVNTVQVFVSFTVEPE